MDEQAWQLSEMRIADVPAFAGLTAAAELTIPAIPAFAERATTDLMRLADAHGITFTGPCVFIYTGMGTGPNDPFTLRVAFPVPEGTTFEATETAALHRYDAFRCAAFDYRGPIGSIGEAYPYVVHAIESAGQRPREQSREVYKHWVAYASAENVVEIQLGV